MQHITAEPAHQDSRTELVCVRCGSANRHYCALGVDCNALCCAGVGDWEGAITLLDEMRTLKLQPDERIYGAAMRACRYTV
jgi:pentatricopeptide repeat protein